MLCSTLLTRSSLEAEINCQFQFSRTAALVCSGDCSAPRPPEDPEDGVVSREINPAQLQRGIVVEKRLAGILIDDFEA
ncbi:MAG TPA: hypothetical protein DDW21_05770 [Verrucomicrobiales bacterium]|nr:MAG: hypothetical protein B9S37_09645 [Verrucomicrobiae bacterium Tous-C3TDCM]PAZ03745.1 MAG: hypothetical protein CAK88_13505 [Verrucomicrobiae bacterium AMD-G2]HBE22940.1 hypothetical protein [Verrucomicrobiales bacterium]